MRELLPVSSILTTIRMLRQGNRQLFLLVEGRSDVDLLEIHLDLVETQIIGIGGKDQVLQLAAEIKAQGVRGAAVLVDRDLDRLTGDDKGYPDVVVSSDNYDLLTDFISHDLEVLTRVIRSHGGTRASAALRQAGVLDIPSTVLSIARSIAALRVSSVRNQWMLNTRDFPVHRVLDSAFEVDETLLIQCVLERSPLSPVSVGQLGSSLASSRSEVGESLLFICSHDIVGACVAILEAAGGQRAGRRQIVASLGTSLDCDTFSLAIVTHLLSAWAAQYDRAMFNCVVA